MPTTTARTPRPSANAAPMMKVARIWAAASGLRPIALVDMPVIALKRLGALAHLGRTRDLDAELRRQAGSLSTHPVQRARLPQLARNFGLSWRMTDCLPAPLALVDDLHLAPMDWLSQPLPPDMKVPGARSNARQRLALALAVPMDPDRDARTGRGDAVIERVRWLNRAAEAATLWPDDPRAGALRAFHDRVTSEVVRADLSGLLQARDEGRSLIVLLSHMAPNFAIAPPDDLGLPWVIVAHASNGESSADFLSTVGTIGEVNLAFLSLAKRLSRQQTGVAIFPDGQSGGSRVDTEILGLPISLGVGAAALARRRPSRLFYARRLATTDHLKVIYEPGPDLGPEVSQTQAETMLLNFYIDRFSDHLRAPPEQIGTPTAFHPSRTGADPT